MKKKVLCMILASLFCLCGLGMLAGCGAEAPDDGYQSPFYTLEEAYAQGLLNQNDLAVIAYDFSQGTQMKGLSANAEKEIKEALYEKFLHENLKADDVTIDSFTVRYRGVFGDCYVFFAGNSFEASDGNSIYSECEMGGVSFSYYRKSNETLMAYKHDTPKEEPWQDYNPQAQAGLYTLREAYEQGVLMPSDLETISYYLFNRSNDPYPESLTVAEENEIQAALLAKFLSDYSEEEIQRMLGESGELNVEDFKIFYYSGEYNGSYVFIHSNPYRFYPDNVYTYDYMLGEAKIRYYFPEQYEVYVYKA